MAATTSSTVTPGCTLTQAHPVVGAAEVEHAEVGDDAAQVVVLARAGAEPRGPVVADAGHDVDLLDEHPAASGFGIQ